MSEKPSRNEEEYFARQEAERLKKMRAAAEHERDSAERQTHYMRCPKCGAHLAHEEFHGVTVDRCPDCGGVWFDKGETEQVLARHEPGRVGEIFNAIFRGVKARTTEDT